MFALLDATAHTGATLTDTAMMNPAASVCALLFNHPQAKYFAVGPIGDDQMLVYADNFSESLASGASSNRGVE